LPISGATSVSQITVSTASTWQKNGRTPLNACVRQCCSRRRVSGVTRQSFGFLRLRQRSTCSRSSLMSDRMSYCWSAVDKPSPSSSTRAVCALVCFLDLGIGVTNDAFRRPATLRCVGWPDSSNSQCRVGAAYGEFRIGEAKNSSVIRDVDRSAERRARSAVSEATARV